MEKFDVANIVFDDGIICVDVTGNSTEGKHYNVTIEELPDGRTRVTGERPRFGFNWHNSDSYDISLLEENSIENYKVWPWSKQTRKRAKEGWLQYKQRYNKTYISSNISITRNQDTREEV